MANEVQIVVSAKDIATGTLKKIGTAIEGESRKAEAALKKLSGLTGVIDKAVKATIVGFGAIGAASIKMGMDAVESENLFKVSMGRMEASARKWSEQLRQQLGLNSYELRKNVGMFDTMFKSMGLSEKSAYDMSTSLTRLSYDMASFYNIAQSDAFEKIQAGVTGEVEPLKRLGIIVNETTTKNYALTHGLIEQGEQLTETQKVMARYGVIMEATSAAQGDLARTMDSPSNQLRVMGDRVKNLGIDLGVALIPAFKSALNAVQPFVKQLEKLSQDGTLEKWGRIAAENVKKAFEKIKQLFEYINQNWPKIKTALETFVGIWAGTKLVNGILSVKTAIQGVYDLTKLLSGTAFIKLIGGSATLAKGGLIGAGIGMAASEVKTDINAFNTLTGKGRKPLAYGDMSAGGQKLADIIRGLTISDASLAPTKAQKEQIEAQNRLVEAYSKTSSSVSTVSNAMNTLSDTSQKTAKAVKELSSSEQARVSMLSAAILEKYFGNTKARKQSELDSANKEKMDVVNRMAELAELYAGKGGRAAFDAGTIKGVPQFITNEWAGHSARLEKLSKQIPQLEQDILELTPPETPDMPTRTPPKGNYALRDWYNNRNSINNAIQDIMANAPGSVSSNADITAQKAIALAKGETFNELATTISKLESTILNAARFPDLKKRTDEWLAELTKATTLQKNQNSMKAMVDANQQILRDRQKNAQLAADQEAKRFEMSNVPGMAWAGLKGLGKSVVAGTTNLINNPLEVIAGLRGNIQRKIDDYVGAQAGLVSNAFLGTETRTRTKIRVVDGKKEEYQENYTVGAGTKIMEGIGQVGQAFAQMLNPLNTFSNILQQINPYAKFVQTILEKLGPVIETLMMPITIVANAFGDALQPVLKALFPVFKAMAIAVAWAGKIAFQFAGGVAKVVASITRFIGNIISGIGEFLINTKLLAGIGRSIKSMGDGILSFSAGADQFAKDMEAGAAGLGEAIKTISDLTWEEAEALKKKREEEKMQSNNIASIFKIALTRSRSSDAVPAMATGGVVYPSGRVVRLGDGGEPEMVVPMSKAGKLGGQTTIHINVGSNPNAAQVRREAKAGALEALKQMGMSKYGVVKFA